MLLKPDGASGFLKKKKEKIVILKISNLRDTDNHYGFYTNRLSNLRTGGGKNKHVIVKLTVRGAR